MEKLQKYSHKIVEAVGVIGGCNCQFTYDPIDGRIVVIEINPRVSRSSAFASKAIFKEALMKAIRPLELDCKSRFNGMEKDELLDLLSKPCSERLFILFKAMRKGVAIEELHNLTHINIAFLNQMKELIDLENEVLKCRGAVLPDELLVEAKENGFTDKYLAILLDCDEIVIREQRRNLETSLNKEWGSISVSSGNDTSYYYSTYEPQPPREIHDNNNKVLILGSGSTRIEQSVEYDYCCLQAIETLKQHKHEVIIINNNSGTVSTDYDMVSKSYIEPLTTEDVYSVYQHEKPKGVIVQFGGQTPLNIAEELKALGVTILGTQPDVVISCERMKDIGLPVLEEHFLQIPTEYEVNAISDGSNVYIPAIIEYMPVDEVHSGDKTCITPPVYLSDEHKKDIHRHTKKLARDLNIKGLLNVKYVIVDNKVFALEATPSASRTVPFMSKICNVPIIQLATEVMIGISTNLEKYMDEAKDTTLYGVRVPVFPFNKLHDVEPVLKPEMQSTGEVFGIARNLESAYVLAQEAAKRPLPTLGGILLSVSELYFDDQLVKTAKLYLDAGFELYATKNTHNHLQEQGIVSHLADEQVIVGLTNTGKINMMFVTTEETSIHRVALHNSIPVLTSLREANLAYKAIIAQCNNINAVESLQSYLA